MITRWQQQNSAQALSGWASDDCRRERTVGPGKAADALRLAPVMTEGVLVEIRLQVLFRGCAAMRAQQPTLRGRCRPVAELEMIVFFFLSLCLNLRVVCALGKRALIISGMAVGFKGGLR